MYRDFIKPAGDRVLALILTVLSMPVILLACVAVRLESPGFPIYVQRRVGRGLKIFTLFKIRSMGVGADRKGPLSTASNDVRVTRVGRFLRATSIDELPQVWNILLGHMSFVGPRPDVPTQSVLYEGSPGSWQERHRVKPGITGLAQARYRSSATFEQRLQSDLEYGRELSFALDCRILVMTVAIVAGRKNTN